MDDDVGSGAAAPPLLASITDHELTTLVICWLSDSGAASLSCDEALVAGGGLGTLLATVVEVGN